MEKRDIPRILRNVLTKRFKGEHFIVLDIGTYNVKGLYVAGGEVVAFANRQYTNGSMNKDGGINERGIANTCRFVLKELRESTTRIGRFTNKVVLGLGGGFVYGKTLTQTYIQTRSLPKESLATSSKRCSRETMSRSAGTLSRIPADPNWTFILLAALCRI